MAKRRAELDDLFDSDIRPLVLKWLDGEFKIDVTNSGNHKPLKEAIQYFCRTFSAQDINKIGAKLLARKSSLIVYLIDRFNVLDSRIKKAILVAASKRANPPKPKSLINKNNDSVLMVITLDDIGSLPNATLKSILDSYAGQLNIKWELTLEQIDKLLFPFAVNKPVYTKSVRERLIIASKRGASEEEMVVAATLHYSENLDDRKLFKIIKDGFTGVDNWNYKRLEEYCDEHGLLSYGDKGEQT